MNYITQYIDQDVNYYVVPVAGEQTGIYMLNETNDEPTASSDDLFKGSVRLAPGSIVAIDDKNYKVAQRRLQNSHNWTFENGGLVFYGLQYDTVYAMDYQHESGYKDHQFTNVEGWFANMQFNPCFGILVDNDDPSKRTFVFYKVDSKWIQNPYLDYTNAQQIESIDDIIHDLLFSIDEQSISSTIYGDYTIVSCKLNRSFDDTKVVIHPLVNTPVCYEYDVNSEGEFSVRYRTQDLYGNQIKFAVYASSICAGTVDVDVGTNAFTLSL